MRPATPRGFRDVAPAEAAERELVLGRLADAFSAWGYDRVETPVVERLDVLEAAAGPLEGTAFRLVDLDGRLLALRPDLTLPIARLAASRLNPQATPLRLRYAAEAFREHESLRGQARQFTQVGVELIGAGGPEADAEVIAVLVEALRASGLARFHVAVGSVAVFAAIIDAAGMGEDWGAAVFRAAHERNLVELDRLAAAPGVLADAARALREVPRIRGDRDATVDCRRATAGCGCERVLDEFERMWLLLEAAGVASNVTADFSVMRSFDYYTGVVFDAYAPGFGVTLGGGGRYDGVLAKFGSGAPAAGFALGLERLSIALVEQGVALPVRALDAVIGGDAADALAAAARLRDAGWRVALSSEEGAELVAEARDRQAIEALVARGERIIRLDRAGEPAQPLPDAIPYAPSATWAREGDAS